MTLQGDIGSVDISDVLAVIGANRKTGLLKIKRGLEEKKLYFVDGRLIFSSSTNEDERLGEILVISGSVKRTDIRSAIEEQKNSSVHLGLMLLKKGVITQNQLFDSLRLQANKILWGVLNWIEGSFVFADKDIELPPSLSISFDLNKLIMDAADKSGKLQDIKRKLPDFALKPQMVPRIDNGNEDIVLNNTEWEILCLADGERTIADICYIIGGSDIETGKIVNGLLERGFLIFSEYTSHNELSRDEQLQKIQLEPIIRLYNEVFRLLHRKAFDLDKTRGREFITDPFKDISTKDDSIFFKDVNITRDGSLNGNIIIDNVMHFPSNSRLEVVYSKFGALISSVLSGLRKSFSDDEVDDIIKSIESVVDFILHQNQNILVRIGVKKKLEMYMNSLGSVG